MSIRDAFVNATENVLSAYLAPELVSQLSEEIAQRALPEVEAALTACVGFEFGKQSNGRPGKAASATRKAPKAPRAKKATSGMDTDDTDDMPISLPSGEDAREMLPA